MSADSDDKSMKEPGRWVTKAEAIRELEISLSTLDRRIRKEEVEAVKRDHRVYVLMHGPEHLSDDELLRRAIDRVDGLERTVYELERARGRRPGLPHPSAKGHVASWRRPMARSAPRTEEQNGWPRPSALSQSRCSRCWPSASLWRGVCSRKN